MELSLFSDMIGKPFKSGAYGPDEYDCWGVCYEASKRMGNPIPKMNISNYSVMCISRTIKNEQKKEEWERLVEPEKGAIIAMPHHVAIMVSVSKFLHVRTDMPVSTDRINNVLWKSKIRGFYKYVG